MEISVRKEKDTLIVSVIGRMDTISSPDLQQKIEEFLDQGERQILIDFQKLDYICSSGLRSTLISAQKARTAGGKLSCCTLRGVVRKVFDISGFTTMLPIFDSVEDALNTE